jgi:hypothetical protein
VTWAWYERVNFYSRQMITLPKKKDMQHNRAPGPLICTLWGGRLVKFRVGITDHAQGNYTACICLSLTVLVEQYFARPEEGGSVFVRYLSTYVAG